MFEEFLNGNEEERERGNQTIGEDEITLNGPRKEGVLKTKKLKNNESPRDLCKKVWTT